MDVWTREREFNQHCDETLPKISLLAHTIIVLAVLEVTLACLGLDLSVHRRADFSGAVSRTARCVARVVSNTTAVLVQLDRKDPDLVTHLNHLILRMRQSKKRPSWGSALLFAAHRLCNEKEKEMQLLVRDWFVVSNPRALLTLEMGRR